MDSESWRALLMGLGALVLVVASIAAILIYRKKTGKTK